MLGKHGGVFYFIEILNQVAREVAEKHRFCADGNQDSSRRSSSRTLWTLLRLLAAMVVQSGEQRQKSSRVPRSWLADRPLAGITTKHKHAGFQNWLVPFRARNGLRGFLAERAPQELAGGLAILPSVRRTGAGDTCATRVARRIADESATIWVFGPVLFSAQLSPAPRAPTIFQ